MVLVKGSEFKEAILKAKSANGMIDLEWLRRHTELWGKSAWIVDGWKGEAKQLSGETVELDYMNMQTFRRDVESGVTSKWDLTLRQMVDRVMKDYNFE